MGKMNGAKNLPNRRTQNKIILLLAKSSVDDRLSFLRCAVENSFWLLLIVKFNNRVFGFKRDDFAVVVIFFWLRQRR